MRPGLISQSDKLTQISRGNVAVLRPGLISQSDKLSGHYYGTLAKLRPGLISQSDKLDSPKIPDQMGIFGLFFSKKLAGFARKKRADSDFLA
mgnify:FL=1